MFSMSLLTAFNVLVLLAPPQTIKRLLGLMFIPLTGRNTLLMAACINIGASLAFEAWGAQGVSSVIGWAMRWWQRGRRRTGDGGKVYKAVEGGMR